MSKKSERFPFLEAKHDGGDWEIRSRFGNRKDPITGELYKFHSGIDINTYSYTKVYAPCDGIITDNRLANDSRGNPRRGGGYMVYLQSDDGFRLRFLHLLEASPYVKVGQRVEKGDLICQTGNSGGSTGAHLHFDVQRNGQWVEPIKYLTKIRMINE